MECQTISHYDGDDPILKDKKKYETYWDARSEATKVNKMADQVYKQIPYLCSQCKKYHLGTSDSALPRK